VSDLRKAAEMALEVLEDPWKAKPDDVADAIIELRQALAQNDLEEAIAKGTKAWADVPNASEWVDDLRGNVDKVSEERVHKTDKSIHEPEWIDDDFGNMWQKCGKKDCGKFVVRVGKVDCWNGDCPEKNQSVNGLG